MLEDSECEPIRRQTVFLAVSLLDVKMLVMKGIPTLHYLPSTFMPRLAIIFGHIWEQTKKSYVPWLPTSSWKPQIS